MARSTFGGTAEDVVESQFSFAGRRLKAAVPNTAVTFWSAATDGTQYTDLLDGDGVAATSITSDADGFLPAFQGPDGVTQMWADAGGARKLMYVQGLAGPAGADGATGPAGAPGDVAGVIVRSTQGQRAMSTDRAVSIAKARLRYEDAAGFTEPWSALTSWATNASALAVSGGYLVKGTSGFALAVQGVSLGATARARYIGTIVAGATGGGGICLIGVELGTAGTAKANANALLGVGIDGNNIPSYWPAGVGGAGSVQPFAPATAFTAGDVIVVTVTIDDANISLCMSKADGTNEYRYRLARSAFTTGGGTINNVAAYCSAPNHKIGPVAYRAASATANPRTGVETVGSRVVAMQSPTTTDNVRIRFPQSVDSRSPMPTVLYCHGAGGSETDAISDSRWGGIETALIGAGYTVAAHLMHDSQWGNATAQADLVDLYKYLRDRWPLGPLFIIGRSMGGLSSLNTIAAGKIAPTAWYGIDPVVSLSSMFANNAGTYASSIRTAYGIASDGSDYSTKTDGFDAALRKGWEFGGVPMRSSASSSDTTVPKAANTDVLLAAVSGLAPEASLFTHTGNHVDATAFNSADILAFLATYNV